MDSSVGVAILAGAETSGETVAAAADQCFYFLDIFTRGRTHHSVQVNEDKNNVLYDFLSEPVALDTFIVSHVKTTDQQLRDIVHQIVLGSDG